MPKRSGRKTVEKQSKSNRGGRRPGAGRRKGAKNASTIEIEEAAKEYAGDALKALLFVATKGKSEGARVAAATALLDRGYGKSRQAVEHSGEGGGPIEIRVVRTIVRPKK